MRNLIKHNNKGSAFVTVIVSVGVIGVLAALVLVITQNSYVTKSVDNQSKVNFYDAEEVVDQLKIGLQNELCECMIDAYFTIIAEFSPDDGTDTFTDSAETARRIKFNKETIGSNSKGFISRINTGSGTYVSKDKLEDLISAYYLADSEDSFTINGKKSSTCNMFYEVASDYSTITIRNIGVEYLNSAGYINSLFTDIVITIPEPDFSMFDPNPNTEYEKYAIMARINLDNSKGAVVTKGSAWIGQYATITGASSRFTMDGEYAYIDGGIKVTNSRMTGSNYSYSLDNTTSSEDARLYTGNLITDNTSYTSTVNAFNIDAISTVKNDLVFEGNYANVTLGGIYYGIGQDGDDPDKNSSIIVNGKNNKLTVNTTNLRLAGNSFIKTYNNGNYTVPNSDESILTGDSLSIRSNELAYLVPSEYMQGLPNPVTRTDLDTTGKTFEALKTDIANTVKADGSISGLVNGSDPVKILYYTYSTNENEKVAYYYLNFLSGTSGARFYNNKVRTKATTRDMLLGLIPVSMTVNSGTFGIGGMYVQRLYANANGVTSTPTITMGNGSSSFVTTQGKIYDTVRSFLTKDVPAKLQQIDAELPSGSKFSERDAIDNIINWAAINEDSNTGLILGDTELNDGTGHSILGYPVSGSNTSSELKVRIFKGDNYTLNENIVGIVIATGDITVAAGRTVNGLIISGGTITVQGNANFIADSEATKNVFNRAALVKTKGGVLLNKILNGYEVDNQAGRETELSTLQLEGMFSYENWCRN